MKSFYKLVSILLISILFNTCKNNTYIFFKDDFEKQNIIEGLKEPWLISGNGKVRIDTLRAYSGKKSVHFISGEGFKNRAFISLENIIPKKAKSYYGSMKMYIKEASPDGIHWTMIQTSGKTEKGFHAEIRYGGQHNKRIMANYDTKEVKTDCWHHTQFKIPEKKWITLEWYFNREKKNMKLWIDTKLVHELNANDFDKGCLENGNNKEWTFPSFDKISLGWVDYQKNGGKREIWIDDVVLSETK